MMPCGTGMLRPMYNNLAVKQDGNRISTAVRSDKSWRDLFRTPQFISTDFKAISKMKFTAFYRSIIFIKFLRSLITHRIHIP